MRLSDYVRFFLFAISALTAVNVSAQDGAIEDKATSITIDGAVFSESIRIGKQSIPLRGAGTATWLRFKVYSAALYATNEREAETDLLDGRPLCLVLHYHRKVKKSDIVESSGKIIRRNPKNDPDALYKPLRDFYALLRPSVDKGDRYVLVYDPAVGSTLYFNDKKLGTVKGADFARAYFGIWISKYPIHAKLRKALVGHVAKK